MADVVVALDVEGPDDALRLVDQLPDLEWVKLGPALYVRHGPALLTELRRRDLKVFLDLKWHDIPRTVAEAARAASAAGVALATVHALGGAEMIQAAAEGAGAMRLAAVTVLTSHSAASYGQATRGGAGMAIADEAVRLADLATGAGAGAVVASAHEAERIRAAVGPDPWIVVPGIRPHGTPADDQRRTATVGEAVRSGATHLVVGRPILRAENPGAVYSRLCEEASWESG